MFQFPRKKKKNTQNYPQKRDSQYFKYTTHYNIGLNDRLHNFHVSYTKKKLTQYPDRRLQF